MSFKNGKDYTAELNLKDVNSSHSHLFLLLEEHCSKNNISSPRVLEVGCNTGYFSVELKNIGAYVYGVEPFTDEALVNGSVDELFFGTVEDFLLDDKHASLPLFDAIVFGDVLEHLVDPEQILKDCLKFLKADGVILVSVPNINHMAIRTMLENGEWIYKKFGLLDSTHIRFFNRHILRKMLANAGLGIEAARVTINNGICDYAPVLSKLMKSGNVNDEDYTYQIIVRASRSAYDSMVFNADVPKNILFFSLDYSIPLVALRMIKPLTNYCKKVGGTLKLLNNSSTVDDICWADVLVIHRECTPIVLNIVNIAKKFGISIVYDLDDLMIELPLWSNTHNTHYAVIQSMKYIIETADRVTCTEPLLKLSLETLSNNVCVVPNVFFDRKVVDIDKIHNNEESCTFILSSSDTVLVSMIEEALEIFFNKYPQHHLITIGPIIKSFSRKMPVSKSYGLLEPYEFSRVVSSYHNPIGIIPLDNSLFSSCKSAIKFFHYTSCGVACIASNVLPYSNKIENGKTGLLVDNSTEDWMNAMEKLASSADIRKLMVARAMIYKNKFYSPEHSAKAWKDAFKGLLKPDEYLKSLLSKTASFEN